ncbi:hypothetical protein [Halococcus salifodinae]|uniref:Uncharacterized protein n=1 Tax=Halococcus salifodinae DSM 8989 TaxID=1227456 RepID=M0NGR9_9EURY|nr:hypothetical protein [Halococcus salifodinae]EMA55870.1 hypothetical protein C450_00060 [Halococcus salifodinae DSM 8989]
MTRLRLHDCANDRSESASPPSNADGSTTTATSTADEPTAGVADLDDSLERVSDGDVAAITDAVANFEAILSADASGDTDRDVFWPYYERVSNGLDTATRTEGWELLGDVIAAYDPTTEEEVAFATPAIANAIGRYCIRTRLTDGVGAIPVGALEYLDAVAVTADDSADIAREEVHAYGWGIGHPDHSVVDRLHARTSADIFSVTPTLEHAFYADQNAAVGALEALVRDESIDGTLPRLNRAEMPYRRYLLDSVFGLKTDDDYPKMPRYYDWTEEFAYSFDLDETVERRIRELVAETGFDDNLSEDWTLRDLGV